MIEAIAAIGASAELAALAPAATTGSAAPAAPGFATWFSEQVGQVNTTLVQTDHEVQALAAGEAGSLHEVMIHLEEAKLSFQLLAQVRNRMLEAYQEVMRMQV
ncbi:flagellar hook-basal body complex protein FliE [Massilia sp. YIM B04103]|uniref:flagellar hook-basal body complex protein FliE n=1 Tax=Massilia sp. YIM B04103 TaxID=2963106 RepID=UPI002109D388|nr:flagellar hook-basal body complex protein FliE [Massilia sp. YIM B04103]